MNRRSLLVVAAIAVVAVLLAIVGRRQSTPETDAGALLLAGLTESLNDVERVVISKAQGEIVATLVRGSAGWSVAEKDDYSADVVKIRQALVALGEARIVEEKTADPAFYDRLGVESVELRTASGTAVAIDAAEAEFPVLILGDEANSGSRYARRADEARSFLVDRNPDVPRSTAQWLIPDIVDVRGTRVQSVTIAHADGERLAISKGDETEANFSVADIPEGRELSYPGVANVIGNALRELKLDDVAGVAGTAGEPAVVTELSTFDGLVVTMTGTMIGDEAWVTFAASAAPQPAVETVPAEAQVEAEAQDAAASAAEPPDPAAEAEAINARVGGWRYRIPEYQYDQLTRRLADLLRAPD
jgi:hypothetical protein